MHATLAGEAATGSMAAAPRRRRAWQDGVTLWLLAGASACGGALGLGAAWSAEWPCSLAALVGWAWLVVASTRRASVLGTLTLSAGWLAWHLAGQGWVGQAVRDGPHAVGWRAAVVCVMLGVQLAPLLAGWWLLAPLGDALRRHAGAITLRWAVALGCAESLRQFGWWGSGYASLGVIFIDAPGAAAWVPRVGGAGWGLLVVALAATVSLAWWYGVSGERRAAAGAAVAACIGAATCAMWPAPRPTPDGAELSVWAIQPPADRGRHWTLALRDEALRELESAIDAVPAGTLLVTAETYLPEPPPRDADDSRWGDLVKHARERGVHLLLGMPHVLRDEDGLHLMNTVVQLSPERQSLYAKERLVPGGEYLPWAGALGPLYARLFERVRDSQRSGPPELTAPMFVAGSTVGVSICHELSFTLTQAARGEDAGWLANLADDAWIDSTLYRSQMLGLARLRALEAGKPLLRVSQGGPTVLVGPDGQVRARAPSEQFAARLALRVAPRQEGAAYPHRAGAVAATPVLAAALLTLLAWWPFVARGWHEGFTGGPIE